MGERLEQPVELVARDPDSRIGHGDLKMDLPAAGPGLLHPHRDAAVMREFERVPYQVGNDLPEADRVADNVRGHLGSHIAGQRKPFRVRLDHQRDQGRLERPAYVKRRAIDLQLARLDLREIENVVDDHQQRFGRLPAE